MTTMTPDNLPTLRGHRIVLRWLTVEGGSAEGTTETLSRYVQDRGSNRRAPRLVDRLRELEIVEDEGVDRGVPTEAYEIDVLVYAEGRQG